MRFSASSAALMSLQARPALDRFGEAVLVRLVGLAEGGLVAVEVRVGGLDLFVKGAGRVDAGQAFKFLDQHFLHPPLLSVLLASVHVN